MFESVAVGTEGFDILGGVVGVVAVSVMGVELDVIDRLKSTAFAVVF